MAVIFPFLCLVSDSHFERTKQNQVVSYFLEFVKKTRGQNWIDRHINLWIAAGAPHCGAPQALRSTVFGDKFGLDRFVTDSEVRDE